MVIEIMNISFFWFGDLDVYKCLILWKFCISFNCVFEISGIDVNLIVVFKVKGKDR